MRGLFILLSLAAGCQAMSVYSGSDYTESNCYDQKQAIVHLFEWHWDWIADECEKVLGPKGFCGVQVSPPMEHIQGGQWWTRYQPLLVLIWELHIHALVYLKMAVLKLLLTTKVTVSPHHMSLSHLKENVSLEMLLRISLPPIQKILFLMLSD